MKTEPVLENSIKDDICIMSFLPLLHLFCPPRKNYFVFFFFNLLGRFLPVTFYYLMVLI